MDIYVYRFCVKFFKKNFFCLAASPKSVMVTTNSAPNFDLEDFFVPKSKHTYKKKYLKIEVFHNIFKATKNQ